jgi:hypothetical protein
MQPSNLKLKYKNLVVATDGNALFIDQRGPATLVFFQIREQTPQDVSADVCAAVRFHNLEELKEFHNNLGETIKKHEHREP